MKKNIYIQIALLLLMVVPVAAEVSIDGFLQGLYGGRLDQSNPTATEQTASETRMQLRAEHFGDNGEFFGRLDFLYDAADSVQYEWELREGYFKFRLGDNLDFKVGRQIITWGTGDLVFINDVFAKDYQSFFVGRDDQYLKAPQNAIRAEYYNSLGSFSAVWTPRFEPNRLPTGRKLSFYNPMVGDIVGSEYYMEAPLPESKFENGEIATRFSRQLGNFNSSLYFYKGFYKNPMGVDLVNGVMSPVYPKLNVYGASLRGAFNGGVLWIEGGYYDSRDDRDGDNAMMPNSSITTVIGFERQVANNLTMNLQWQADAMLDHDIYEQQQTATNSFVRDEVKHLFTSRITKLVYDELVNLSAFVFYSPNNEDMYLRLAVSYKHTDEVTLSAGSNIFYGTYKETDFGQFQLNDNVYLKMTYGF